MDPTHTCTTLNNNKPTRGQRLLGQVGETGLNGHAASAEALPDKRPISTVSSTYTNDAFDTGVYHEIKH